MKTAALLAGLVASPLLAQAPVPPDPLATFRGARLTGRALDAAGRTFEWGGGTYRFSAGSLWEIARENGTTQGFFFEGAATLSWSAGDETAARVYAANAGRIGGVSAGPGNVLTATFSRGTFRSSSAALPGLAEPTPASSPPPAESFLRHLQRFREDRTMPTEAGLAVASENGSAFAESLLEAGKDLRHRVDGAIAFDETLTEFERPSGTPSTFPGWRYPAVIARRPVGHARRAPPPPQWTLTGLFADVRELDGGWGRFSIEETLAVEKPVKALALSLRTDILSGRTYAPASVVFRNATVGGKNVRWALEKDTLVVVLPEPAAPGSEIRLAAHYDAPFLARRGGDNLWELPIGSSWYPEPAESRSAARFTFRSVVRARRPFVPFVSGETVRRAEDGAYNLVETRLEKPVPFVAAVAGAYTVQEETREGVTCRVASYGVAKERSGARLTNLFHRMRHFYEPYFGPFPWKEYTIVEVPSYGFGQAPPGMMRITQEAFQANVLGADPLAAFFSAGVNERLAHEIAHAWWGYGVWGATEADQWIEESFAETAAGRLIEDMKDRGEYTILSNVWRTRAKEASGLAPIALANELARKFELFDSSGLWIDRFYLTYFKGAVLLQAIRKELGDDAFFTVLKSFQRSFEKKPAVTTDQFVGLLSYVTKKDWKPWFEKYYYGYEMP